MPLSKSNLIFDYELAPAYPINFRIEHKYYLKELKLGGKLYRQLKNLSKDQPLDAILFIWRDKPEEFVSFLTLRAIRGIESYLLMMLPQKAYQNQKLTGELLEIIANPYGNKNIRKILSSTSDRPGAFDYLYIGLPKLIDETIVMPADLMNDMRRFYRDVRNPLFHGSTVTTTAPEPLLRAYEMIDKVYDWIDSWCPPEAKGPGFSIKWA